MIADDFLSRDFSFVLSPIPNAPLSTYQIAWSNPNRVLLRLLRHNTDSSTFGSNAGNAASGFALPFGSGAGLVNSLPIFDMEYNGDLFVTVAGNMTITVIEFIVTRIEGVKV